VRTTAPSKVSHPTFHLRAMSKSRLAASVDNAKQAAIKEGGEMIQFVERHMA
jgi:hypothetical protein